MIGVMESSDDKWKRSDVWYAVGTISGKIVRDLKELRRREEIVERMKKMPPVHTETRTGGTVAAGCSRENGETAVPQGKSTARPQTTVAHLGVDDSGKKSGSV